MSKEKLIKHQKEMLEVEENEIDEDFRCAASTPPPPEQFDDKDEEVFKQHQMEMLGEDEPQPPPNISYGEADEDFRCTSVTPLQSPFFGCKNKNTESFEDGKNDAFGDFRCAASTPPRAEEEEELDDNDVFKKRQLEMLGEDEPEPPPNISYGDEDDDEDDDEHYSSTHSTPPLTFITNISDAGHGLDQLVKCLPQTLLAKIAPASAAIFVGENEAEEQEEAENKMVGQPKDGIQEAQTVQPSSSQSPAKFTKAKVRSYDREAFMKVRKSRTADEWNAYLWTNHAESWEIDSHPFELDPELRVPFWKQLRVVRQREEERRRWSEVGKQPYPYHMKQQQYRSQQQAWEQKGKKNKMKKEKPAGTTSNPVGDGNERGGQGQQADGAMVVEFGRRAIERSKQFTAKKRAEKQAKREALLAKAAEKDWTESELDEEEDEEDDDIDEESGEEQSKEEGKEQQKKMMKKKGADDGVFTPKANGNSDTAGGKQKQQSQEQHCGGAGAPFPFCAHGPPFSFAEMAAQANWIAAQPQFQAYMAELTAAMSQMHLNESSEQ